MAYLARDPLILSLSMRVATVISFILGTSSTVLLYRASSKNTLWLALSFTFPLVHFLRPALLDDDAAFAIASLVFLPPATGCFP
jgi:hypothetical protein